MQQIKDNMQKLDNNQQKEDFKEQARNNYTTLEQLEKANRDQKHLYKLDFNRSLVELDNP